ncbi:hypothetical protein [Methylocystis sp. H62]|uniref:hypothetical protein n=1 Tax=Methylocystis sp. H62 TaxID=2785789 RepID=UPI001FEE8BE8|nr:hypothetical protein [Methylocystis sp. H62]
MAHTLKSIEPCCVFSVDAKTCRTKAQGSGLYTGAACGLRYACPFLIDGAAKYSDVGERVMILVLIFVGVALAAGGVLSLLDGQFKVSKVTAVMAFVGGLIMVVGAEAGLIGSSSSFFKAQQIKTSACELDGESAYPENRRLDPDHLIRKYILGCMAQSGYAWTSDHEHCKEAPLATNPLCYLPTGLFDRAVTKVQVAFE